MILTSEITGQVGLQTLTDGAASRPAMSKRGSFMLSPEVAEAAERGRCFSVCNQAGVTSQAGLSATTPVLTLYNASGSGKIGKLWFAGATFTVAPATVGVVWIAVGSNPVAAAVTGTATTAHRNLKLGGAAPTLQPLLAATLPAAPVGVCILGTNYTGAVTTTPQAQALYRWLMAPIIIAPGTNVSIQTGVASGASGLFCEFIWEEEDE